MEYTTVQLNRLAEIPIPRAILGTDEQAYFLQDKQYRRLKFWAIYSLKKPRNEKAKSRLSTLINELGIVVN
jgi:hypothetical protein